MQLHTRRWGPTSAGTVVCVHGIAQHGGIFETLGRSLVEAGYQVVSVDLRGHGKSDREPPWDTGTHVADLLETAADLGIERATWVGHSFGGYLSAALAATAAEQAERLVLLDPAFEISPAYALKSAEIDRLDWSFATVEGAVNALLSSDSMVAPPRETVTRFVADDLQPGPDGRLRFSHCPSTAVVAWNEITLPPPAVAKLPTLLVRPVTSAVHSRDQDRRYRDELGSLLTMAAVPHGHNVLWEAPEETTAAISGFLDKTRATAGRI